MSEQLILLVEDNKKVQNFNKSLLQGEGFAVETAMTLAKAWESIKKKPPDAIILDIGMPDGSGLDFLRQLRQTSRVPVLMLTGFGASEDVVQGFLSGCDDYLPKPYTFGVLLVRLRRLLKSAEQVPETVKKGRITLKTTSLTALLDGEDLHLPQKEFALLHFFIQREDKVITSEYIYEQVWGQPMAGNSQALGKVISKLRKKLKDSGYTISVEYKNGYIFERE